MKVSKPDFSDPMGAIQGLGDNYLVIQAMFKVLGLNIGIDISIQTGSIEEGGGIHCWFGIVWYIPFTTIPLGEFYGKAVQARP